MMVHDFERCKCDICCTERAAIEAVRHGGFEWVPENMPSDLGKQPFSFRGPCFRLKTRPVDWTIRAAEVGFVLMCLGLAVVCVIGAWYAAVYF